MSDDILYQGMTRAELDRQYNNREHVPTHAEIYAGWVPKNTQIAKDFETRLDVAYGDHPREKLDIFIPEGDGPFPIRVFVHGGYWMSRDKEHTSFIARGLLEKGAIVVSVEYALIPSVDMTELVRQCQAAVAWCARNAQDFKGDADRLYVSGHSAGGHIAAMLATVDWTKWDLPAGLVKGSCAVSGLFDLTPMRLCYIDDVLHLAEEDVRTFSPITLSPVPSVDVIFAVGGAETDEFIRQSKACHESWSGKSASVSYLEVPGANHFTVLDAYADGTSGLCQAMADQMGL